MPVKKREPVEKTRNSLGKLPTEKKSLKFKDINSLASSKANSVFEQPLPPSQYEFESGRKKVRCDKVSKMKEIKQYFDSFFKETKDLCKQKQ